MKKRIFGALACAGVLLLMGACSEKSCKSGKACDDDQVYAGLVPAADADGVHYTLKLDYDDDMKDGDFDMVQTYVKTDSLGTADLKSFKSKGDFTVEDRDGVKYLKLVAKRSSEAPVYLQVTNDSTLTLVNDSLQVAPSGLDYTLHLVR